MPASAQKVSAILKLLKKETDKLPLPWVSLLARRGGSPFQVLIASVLSVRTKDNTTQAASERLFARAAEPQEMLKLSRKAIAELIYPAGFYRRKAADILRISQELCRKYGGEVPQSRDDLMSLPGVGRKVANLVLGLSFRQPLVCVDTHVHRISNRLGIVESDDVYTTEAELERVIPLSLRAEFNTVMVSFGQYICLPRRPLCARCSLFSRCMRKGVGYSS